MRKKTNFKTRSVKENLRSRRISRELDECILEEQRKLRQLTGLDNINYTEVTRKVARIFTEARRSKKKKNEFELDFDTRV